MNKYIIVYFTIKGGFGFGNLLFTSDHKEITMELWIEAAKAVEEKCGKGNGVIINIIPLKA